MNTQAVQRAAIAIVKATEGLTDQEALAAMAIAAGQYLETLGNPMPRPERTLLVRGFMDAVATTIGAGAMARAQGMQE